MSRWNDWEPYEPSRPRAARGGIKANSRRGSFGQNWWARRWLAVLESFQIGARLHRGRAYARQGQVLAINVAPGAVTAQVQGSRKRPYRVTINVRTLSPEEWQRLAQTLAGQAIFAAKLVAGEMPPDIETAFASARLSLFPERRQDLQTDCSCPDWSNPCKHTAAVYYLLAEEFDRDPFLIFQLRGISRDELVALIAGAVPAGSGRGSQAQPEGAAGEAGPAADEPAAEPLLAEAAAFWQGGNPAGTALGEAVIPSLAAALPRQLGNFPFWRGNTPLLSSLAPIYDRAGQAGIQLYLASREEAGEDGPVSES